VLRDRFGQWPPIDSKITGNANTELDWIKNPREIGAANW
jgi:hypothetical protein